MRRLITGFMLSISILAVLLTVGCTSTSGAPSGVGSGGSSTVLEKKPWYEALTPADEPINILLVGGDNQSDNPGDRSDAIMLIRLSPSTREVWMMTLPRDAKVPGYLKLNASYSHKGFPGLEKSVYGLTGFRPDYRIKVGFDGLVKVIDELGGIDIDNPEAISDRKADASPGKKYSKIPAGPQHLNGYQALTFLRTRSGLAGEYGRQKRHRIFVEAMLKKIFSVDAIESIPAVVKTAKENIWTDMSTSDILRYAFAFNGERRVYSSQPNGVWRSPSVYLDKAETRGLAKDMLSGKPFRKVEDKGSF